MEDRILIADDDPSILMLISDVLTDAGIQVRTVASGEETLHAVGEETFSLIILDIMMKGISGLEVCAAIRDKVSCPILFLSAKDSAHDIIEGLGLGADDYLTKPFGMMEMVSRVRAVLRRCHADDKPQILRQGGLSVDPTARTVTAGGAPVTLTYKEFELLCLFLQNPGTVFTRDRLFSEVWGESFVGETRTVDMHIRTLRQKLGTYGDRIETVRGVGYKLLPADAQM